MGDHPKAVVVVRVVRVVVVARAAPRPKRPACVFAVDMFGVMFMYMFSARVFCVKTSLSSLLQGCKTIEKADTLL